MCKVEFEKAYDKLDKDFLLQVLKMDGFPDNFIRWVKVVVSDGKVVVLINEQIGSYFKMDMGLDKVTLYILSYLIWLLMYIDMF